MIRIRVLAAVMLLPALASAQAGAESYRQARALFDADNKKNAEAAAKLFEKATAQEPNNADYHVWFARAIGTQAMDASVFRQPFLAKHAKAEFEKAVQLDPNNIGGREGLLQFHLRAPSVMGGSRVKAKEQADALMRISPLRGHFALAQVAAVDKDMAGAEREYRAAYAIAPDSAGAAMSLAVMLINNGKPDEAIAILDKRIAAHPEEPGPHYRLGAAFARKGDNAKARKAYERAIQLNPNFENAKKALKALP